MRRTLKGDVWFIAFWLKRLWGPAQLKRLWGAELALPLDGPPVLPRAPWPQLLGHPEAALSTPHAGPLLSSGSAPGHHGPPVDPGRTLLAH